jgi:hypothetical protein
MIDIGRAADKCLLSQIAAAPWDSATMAENLTDYQSI